MYYQKLLIVHHTLFNPDSKKMIYLRHKVHEERRRLNRASELKTTQSFNPNQLFLHKQFL